MKMCGRWTLAAVLGAGLLPVVMPGAALAGVAGAAASVAAAAGVLPADQALPTDPRLLTGELDNGMKYIVVKHASPPGRAALWLHVSTGSLNETEPQRGIAHYLEHMAFNGSANFKPGSLIPFFESLGLTFGVHQNAFTGFDQTSYQMFLPEATPEKLSKGMLFLSDVASRLDLSQEEIDAERDIILEEKKTREGGQQRVQEVILERLAPGSIFGQRLPIGVEETIRGVQRPDFVDFYSRWYVPSNMTFIVVADADPAMVVDAIKKNFSGGEKRPRPVDQAVGVTAYTETRAIVASDKELTNASLAIVRVEPPRSATTTVGQLRDDWITLIGTTAFNRRMSAKISAGSMSFLSAGASVADLAEALRWVQATASGKPENWQKMLTELSAEVQRARLHGFTDREIEDVRKDLLARGEQAVQTEPTRDARQLISQINTAVASGEPFMSAQQTLDKMRAMLPGVSASEVSQRFAQLFDPQFVTFTLTLPSSGGTPVPSEKEVVALGVKALDVKPPAEAEAARPTELLAKKPQGGKVQEQSEHAASGVTSAWLSNGVRVHVRPMDYRKDTVWISIGLAAGEIMEEPSTRGLTQAAGLAWSRPATSTLSSTNIRDLMTGKKVQVGGGGGSDLMSMSIQGSPEEIEAGLQLAYLMLTDPVIEAAALDQWKTRQKQLIAARGNVMELALQSVMADTMYPKGEVRPRPLTAEQVDAVKLADAQRWLKDILAIAPIEVAVVGDIEAERAMELVTTYLGALPARNRISDRTLAPLRTIKRDSGARETIKTLPTQTDKALVLTGFFGADARSVRDVRLLDMARRVISTRMIADIREAKQLVYSIGAQNIPATDYPGFGLFFAFSSTSIDKIDALQAAVNEQYKNMATNGPTEEEMATVRRQVANSLDESMKEPQFWLSRMRAMNYRGVSMDDVVSEPEAMQSFTAQEIRETFARYYTPESIMHIVIKPEAAAAPAAAPAEAPKSN